MKNTPIAFALCLILLAGCSAGLKHSDAERGVYAAADAQRFVDDTSAPSQMLLEPEYVIGVGDVIDVVFIYHTNLTTRDLIVRRDGRISLPYVGDEMAAGFSPMTLDSILTADFSKILRDPNVAVIVKIPAKQKVFVLGEVVSPGRYTFDDELSVVQSVALAGGIKNSASASHAVLIRRLGVQKIVGIEIDIDAVLNGALMQNDLRLRNYDIVYIPMSPLYNAAGFMRAVEEIIRVPMDAVFKGWQVVNLSASYEFFRNSNGQ